LEVQKNSTAQVSAPCARPSRQDSPQHSSSFFQSPWSIVVIALLLRLLVITVGHTYKITPRRDYFQFGWEAGRIARSIATGHGFASPTDLPTGPTAWEAPLYPYLLAGVFKLFGVYSRGSAWIILAINSIFSALTCVSIYRIAARLFGPQPARWAAWTWTLFPYAIYWPVRVVWETSISTFLLSLAFLLTLRLEDAPNRRHWIFLGLLWGVIALSNPTMLTFMPLSLAWIWHKLRNRNTPGFAGICATLLLCVVVITPWIVRNYAVFHRFIFIRDNLWMELHLANNPESQGRWTRSEHPGNDPQQMRRFAEMGELAYMDQEKREVIEFVRQQPLEFIGYSLQRAVYFWIGNPQAALAGSWDLGPARHTAFLLSALAAFAGLWLCIRNRVPATFLFVSLMVVFPIPYYIAHPSPRYRHAIEPEMVLLIIYLLWQARGKRMHWPIRNVS
jgi:4-amino-4-deoxy-L-arabinose transferase-like glycosyltransferase